MKNRDYKQFVSGQYYHIFNRGNNKQDIFRAAEDFVFFLKRLRENLFPNDSSLEEKTLRSGGRLAYKRKSLPQGAFTLVSYCLMPNHFHFLIRQNGDIGIDRLMAKLCTSYAIYFNKRYESVGNVLQAKFKAIIVDKDAYLMWLSAYIHQNPKVAGLVDKLDDYPWSSYLDYVGKRAGSLCDKDIIFDSFKGTARYQDFVDQSFENIKIHKHIEHLLLDQ